MNFTLIVPISNRRNLRSSGRMAHRNLTVPATSTKPRRQLHSRQPTISLTYASIVSEGDNTDGADDLHRVRPQNKGPHRGVLDKKIMKASGNRHYNTDVRGKYSDFVSQLCANDRQVLHKVMREYTDPREESALPESVKLKLKDLPNANEPSRDGLWYFQMTQCCTTKLGRSSKSPRHPQWQFSVAEKRKGRMRDLVAAGLSKGATDGLKALPNKTKTHEREARIFPHLIAYAAKPEESGDELLQIPNNKKTGGGISHLCDNRGCIRPEHLRAAWRHKENTDRRGCAGIELMVGVNSRAILNETACPHADESRSTEQQLRSSCQRIRFCPVDGEFERCMVQARTIATNVVLVKGGPRKVLSGRIQRHAGRLRRSRKAA